MFFHCLFVEIIVEYGFGMIRRFLESILFVSTISYVLSVCMRFLELVIFRVMEQKQVINEEEIRGTIEAIASTGKFWYFSSPSNFHRLSMSIKMLHQTSG